MADPPVTDTETGPHDDAAAGQGAARPGRAPSRRTLLGVGGAVAGAAAAGVLGFRAGAGGDGTAGTDEGKRAAYQGAGAWPDQVEPFRGEHQAGILTAPQAHATFVALDLAAGSTRDDLARLLRSWTTDADRLTRGQPTLADPQPDLAGPASRLTVTVGVGRGALEKTGLADRAPAWLAPLPAFAVDRLEPQWSEGDVLAQVCGDDPIVLAHAVRALLVSAQGIAAVRWMQRGFRRPATSPATMRNLMGQVDGTVQPAAEEAGSVLWVGDEGPRWLRGGTSLVLRRIAMNLDTWDELDPEAKEAVIGRRLTSGAPLTGRHESDPADLAATKDGLPVIPAFAHIRNAAPAQPDERVLRRPYNYEETPTGTSTARAGLLFAAYQRDPVAQFAPIQQRIAGADLLNMWTTPIGSAVFALFPGCAAGAFLGQDLLQS